MTDDCRRAVVPVTAEALVGLLARLSPDLPAGARYRGCYHDWERTTFNLVLEHPSFAPVFPGEPMPRLDLRPRPADDADTPVVVEGGRDD